MNKIIAFTGHRPDKLSGGYKGDHTNIKDFIKDELQKIITMECVGEFAPNIQVIVGGAQGTDQIAHKAALEVYNCDIILIEPFKGFWRKWPIDSIENYMWLKYHPKTSYETLDKSEFYAPYKMQHRNEEMVNRATEIWAWWDGSEGGTANCVAYAKKIDKPVRNLYNEFNGITNVRS